MARSVNYWPLKRDQCLSFILSLLPLSYPHSHMTAWRTHADINLHELAFHCSQKSRQTQTYTHTDTHGIINGSYTHTGYWASVSNLSQQTISEQYQSPSTERLTFTLTYMLIPLSKPSFTWEIWKNTLCQMILPVCFSGFGCGCVSVFCMHESFWFTK